MESAPIIKTRILHRQPVVAAGIHGLLSGTPGFSLQDDGAGAGHASRLDLQLVVADYASGMEWLASERGAGERAGVPRVPMLILTELDGETEVRQALAAGAAGYLLQHCSATDLVDAARSVAFGMRYVAPGVAQRLAESLTYTALTAREIDVLQLIACGSCNKTIARKLDISVGTVKTHVSSILEKLSVSSRTQAISRAGERGLIGSHAPRKRGVGVWQGLTAKDGSQARVAA